MLQWVTPLVPVPVVLVTNEVCIRTNEGGLLALFHVVGKHGAENGVQGEPTFFVRLLSPSYFAQQVEGVTT